MASTTNSKYFDEYFNSLMAAQKPSFEKEKFNIYEFLMNLGQRQGIGSAMLQASRATAPFAAEFAKNAAKASGEATNLAEQRDRFEKELAQRQEEFNERMDQQNQQYLTSSQMSMFPQTGWTSELMNALGYGNYAAPSSQFSNVPNYGPGSAASGSGGTGANANNMWYNQVYSTGHPLYNAAAQARARAGGGTAGGGTVGGASYSIK